MTGSYESGEIENFRIINQEPISVERYRLSPRITYVQYSGGCAVQRRDIIPPLYWTATAVLMISLRCTDNIPPLYCTTTTVLRNHRSTTQPPLYCTYVIRGDWTRFLRVATEASHRGIVFKWLTGAKCFITTFLVALESKSIPPSPCFLYKYQRWHSLFLLRLLTLLSCLITKHNPPQEIHSLPRS